jgi:hypothetical protein
MDCGLGFGGIMVGGLGLNSWVGESYWIFTN